MTRIKICGLRCREDILWVNQIRPDYCGFVIECPRSFRSVTREEARALSGELSPEILPVGVFVNRPAEEVAELLEEGTLALAQLHGQEDEAYLESLRKLTGKPLIQAFSVKSAEDIRRALESSADYILLDQEKGGSGIPFDWTLIPEIERPFFLAGGLCPENLREALERVRPWAVDLSSGLETQGRKDPVKMRRAVELVRVLSRGQSRPGVGEVLGKRE